jgi:hypothetical protein
MNTHDRYNLSTIDSKIIFNPFKHHCYNLSKIGSKNIFKPFTWNKEFFNGLCDLLKGVAHQYSSYSWDIKLMYSNKL